MEIFLEVCKWIVIILTAYTLPLTIWMFVTVLVGLRKPKDGKPAENKLHRFAVLVCARNEEAVIGNLLRSIKRQDYKGKFQLFVVADNCTDATAAVAREIGAIVFVRNDETKKGKGYALSHGISRITKTYDGEFDAVCVFDADNLAAADFLTEMNNALCSGAVAAQGYRDTKNIHDSWVSEVYSVYWLMLMRFYYHPRQLMGLSSMVGGTGFAFKLSALGDAGWATESLTEDVEFSIQQILKGNRVTYARKAAFYDEQPASYGVSVKQRLRWMTGGMQCIPLYIKQVAKAIFRGEKCALDVLWYLLFIPAAGLTIPLNIASVCIVLATPGLQPFALPLIIGFCIASWCIAMVIAYLTLRLEGRDIRSMKRAIALYPFFMLTMMFISLFSLVRPHTEWVPIRHENVRTIEELEGGR